MFVSGVWCPCCSPRINCNAVSEKEYLNCRIKEVDGKKKFFFSWKTSFLSKPAWNAVLQTVQCAFTNEDSKETTTCAINALLCPDSSKGQTQPVFMAQLQGVSLMIVVNRIWSAGSKNSSLPHVRPHQLCAVRITEQFKEDCAESDQNHPCAYKGSDRNAGPSKLTARGYFSAETF